MLIKRSSEITDQKVYGGRREFIKAAAGVAGAGVLAGTDVLSAAGKPAPQGRKLADVQPSPIIPLHIIASIHAAVGRENAVERALVALLAPSRAEVGCLAMDAFRSMDDERLFYIHSHWQDEAAFQRHTQFPHALGFMTEVTVLTDRPIESSRTRLLTT